MPEENIKVIEEKNVHLWFDGSPVSVCTQRLALDIDKADLFASFKLINLQPDNIRDIIFDVVCYNSQRQIIDTVYDVSYTGFDVMRNIEFGYGRRVPVKNQETRSVEFVLKSVVNSSGHTWINNENKRFDTALEQESIFRIQGDLNKQFLEICTRSGIDGTAFSLQPVFRENFWLCGCGSFNWGNEEVCSGCGVGKMWLSKNSDLEVLKKQSGFEEQQRAEIQATYAEFRKYENNKKAQIEEFASRRSSYQKQLKQQKLKKGSKSLIVVLIILTVLAAIFYGIVFWGLPMLKYKSAVTDYEMFRYDEAISKFTQLGNFLDSRDFRMKSLYGYAFSCYTSGEPEKAAELFNDLGDYTDSHQKYLECLYKSAENKYKNGEYIEASSIFDSMEDYAGAAEAKKKCINAIYRDTQTNLLTNTVESLEKALEELNYIGSYKKSPERLSQCLYLLGNAYYKNHRYKDAVEKYLSATDNEEVKKNLENIKTLAALISTAEKGKYAVWQSNPVHCTDCTKNNAVYSLKLGVNGEVLFYSQCSNKKTNQFEKKGIFTLENNVLTITDSSSDTRYILKIKSLKSGEKAVLSVDMDEPYDKNVTSVELHGSTK